MTRLSRLLVISMLSLAGCTSLPETSRTGDIHTVRVGEQLSPARVVVEAGDEIRWVNLRTQPVRLEFLGDDMEDLRCQRGFIGFVGRVTRLGSVGETASLNQNETASLCFGRAGTVSYNIRAAAATPGGQVIESGTVVVNGD